MILFLGYSSWYKRTKCVIDRQCRGKIGRFWSECTARQNYWTKVIIGHIQFSRGQKRTQIFISKLRECPNKWISVESNVGFIISETLLLEHLTGWRQRSLLVMRILMLPMTTGNTIVLMILIMMTMLTGLICGHWVSLQLRWLRPNLLCVTCTPWELSFLSPGIIVKYKFDVSYFEIVHYVSHTPVSGVLWSVLLISFIYVIFQLII